MKKTLRTRTPKLGTTEVRRRFDGMLVKYRFVTLEEAGVEALPGHWHKPQWVPRAVFPPRKRRK